jgi:hypothetical protein
VGHDERRRSRDRSSDSLRLRPQYQGLRLPNRRRCCQVRHPTYAAGRLRLARRDARVAPRAATKTVSLLHPAVQLPGKGSAYGLPMRCRDAPPVCRTTVCRDGRHLSILAEASPMCALGVRSFDGSFARSEPPLERPRHYTPEFRTTPSARYTTESRERRSGGRLERRHHRAGAIYTPLAARRATPMVRICWFSITRAAILALPGFVCTRMRPQEMLSGCLQPFPRLESGVGEARRSSPCRPLIQCRDGAAQASPMARRSATGTHAVSFLKTNPDARVLCSSASRLSGPSIDSFRAARIGREKAERVSVGRGRRLR